MPLHDAALAGKMMSVNGPTAGSQPSQISTWEMLRTLGFIEDATVMSDPMPGLSFDFGDFKLSAGRFLNLKVEHVVLLSGFVATKRALVEVEYNLPLTIESVEQGMAFLAYTLDNHFDGHFQPTIEPAWLAEGRRNRHLLPIRPWGAPRAASSTG